MQSRVNGAASWVLIIVVLSLAGGALWWWQQQNTAPLRIRTATVESGPLSQQLLATGHVVNARRMHITALLPGRIQAVSAEPGERVQRDQVLFEQDPQTVQIALAEATLKRQLAQVALADAARSLKLSAQMRRKKVISEDELQLAKHRHQSAQLELQLAQNALSRVELRLQYTRVTAPFDAWVVQRMADVGQWVDEGTALLELAAADENRIELKLDASDVGSIEIGMPVSLRSEAYPQRRWQEHVDWRANVVDNNDDNQFSIHLSLGDQAPPLLLGQRVDADFELAREDDVLQLPIQHLRLRDGVSGVWLLHEGALHWRELVTGLQNDSHVQIVSGLALGDRVLAAGENIPPRGRELTAKP